MTEHERARRWRERHNLSKQQLAELSGYSWEAINLFEKGSTPSRTWAAKPSRPAAPINGYVWQRFKRVCQGVEAELGGGRFDW